LSANQLFQLYGVDKIIMQVVLSEIQYRQEKFSELQFFKRLEKSSSLQDAEVFAPGLSFFVLAFQDILRLNEDRITDPVLRPIVRHHRQEDLGHDAWFLYDLRQLGKPCDAELLFGKEQEVTRDTSFEIVSEIFQASDDRVRLVIPLALEAMGHPFFSRVHKFFVRAGFKGQLRYFSKEHFLIEQSHEMFKDEIDAQVNSIELSSSLRAEAIGVVGRTFDAVTRMIDTLDQRIAQLEVNSRELQLR
jgi:hypothetical protein